MTLYGVNRLAIVGLICLLVFSLAGCNNTDEPMVTQEEFQVELIEMLNKLEVVRSQDYWDGSQVVLGDDTHIDVRRLAVYLHIYEIGFAAGEHVPTVEQVLSLYDSYDQTIYDDFHSFWGWQTQTGGQVGYKIYTAALSVAENRHNDEHGARFLGNETPFTAPFDQLLDLEEYIKKNPALNETNEDYQTLLKWLGVTQ